jgi:hypothetical protein
VDGQIFNGFVEDKLITPNNIRVDRDVIVKRGYLSASSHTKGARPAHILGRAPFVSRRRK